jgi:hypothetical protein
MENINREAYRQGLSDSRQGAQDTPNRYPVEMPADILANQSWRLGIIHGVQMLQAADEYAKATQLAMGAGQQKAVDDAFLARVARCFEATV